MKFKLERLKTFWLFLFFYRSRYCAQYVTNGSRHYNRDDISIILIHESLGHTVVFFSSQYLTFQFKQNNLVVHSTKAIMYVKKIEAYVLVVCEERLLLIPPLCLSQLMTKSQLLLGELEFAALVQEKEDKARSQ